MTILKATAILFCACVVPEYCAEGLNERDPRYRIQPSDVIEVQYRYTPEYNHSATIQPDGFAALQLIGDVKIAGLTVDEASAAITRKASERLKNPELTVTLKEFVKPFFTVAGEVNHPGRFDLRGRMTAVEGIAISGGFKESSKRTTVILLRQTGADMAEVKVLDLRKL